jgi:hypothetical protein
VENIKQKNQEFNVRRGYRSLFWPLLLICIGVVWLLSNFGIFSLANIIALVQLWPLLLIVGGFELLFGRSSPQLARIIGVGTLVFALAFAFVGPALGIGKVEVKTERFSEPLGETVTANVRISPSVGKASISAATDSNNLFDADVTYAGKLNYSHQGDKDKSISLQQDNSTFSNFGFLNTLANNADLRWDVKLNPAVAINLTVENGVGDSTLDLGKLKLTGVDIKAGAGNVTLTMPGSDTGYSAKLEAGVGNVKMTLPADGTLDLKVNAGLGNIDITVPEGTAMQVFVNSGLGKVNFASNLNFTKTGSRDKDNDGTYETPNFSSASHKIVINYDGGMGNFSVHS